MTLLAGDGIDVVDLSNMDVAKPRDVAIAVIVDMIADNRRSLRHSTRDFASAYVLHARLTLAWVGANQNAHHGDQLGARGHDAFGVRWIGE